MVLMEPQLREPPKDSRLFFRNKFGFENNQIDIFFYIIDYSVIWFKKGIPSKIFPK